MPLKSQQFTSSGSFLVPSGVSCVWLTGIGGGGQGTDGKGCGGGAGGYGVGIPMYVTAGQIISIVVGTGGVAGRTSGPFTNIPPMRRDSTGGGTTDLGYVGTAPSASSVGTFIFAPGVPSFYGISVGHPGGGMGGGGGTVLRYPEESHPTGWPVGLVLPARYGGGPNGGGVDEDGGGSGGDRPGGAKSVDSAGITPSGGGASSIWGDGGAAGPMLAGGASGHQGGLDGEDGTGYGSGGGGGGQNENNGFGYGGDGADGMVLIVWAA